MEDKTPLIFVAGMNFQSVSPNAPETVRGKIYFKWSEFKAFAEANLSDRGYLNIQMMKSKDKGSIYFIKDTFVPKQSAETKDYNEHKYKHPDPNVQLANEKSAEELFGKPLSEDEQFQLSQMPF